MVSTLQLEVAHSVLYVHDREAMINFYTDVLGFEVTDRGPLRALKDPRSSSCRKWPTIIIRWRSSGPIT